MGTYMQWMKSGMHQELASSCYLSDKVTLQGWFMTILLIFLVWNSNVSGMSCVSYQSLFFFCCDKMPCSKATYRKKRFFVVVVPEKQSVMVGGGMESREITSTANTNGKIKQGEALKNQSLPSVLYFLQQGCTASPNSINNWGPSIQVLELIEGVSHQSTVVYKAVLDYGIMPSNYHDCHFEWTSVYCGPQVTSLGSSFISVFCQSFQLLLVIPLL